MDSHQLYTRTVLTPYQSRITFPFPGDEVANRWKTQHALSDKNCRPAGSNGRFATSARHRDPWVINPRVVDESPGLCDKRVQAGDKRTPTLNLNNYEIVFMSVAEI